MCRVFVNVVVVTSLRRQTSDPSLCIAWQNNRSYNIPLTYTLYYWVYVKHTNNKYTSIIIFKKQQ